METPTTLIEAIQKFSDPQFAHDFLVSVRWSNGVTCPRCGCDQVGFVATRRVWNCKGCKKQFSAKVGTIFEDSPLGLDKWLTAFWLVVNAKNGISSCELSPLSRRQAGDGLAWPTGYGLLFRKAR